MEKITKCLILSFIFFSISSTYIILEFTYPYQNEYKIFQKEDFILKQSTIPEDQRLFQDYMHTIEGVNIKPFVNLLTINPFDYYFTYIENCIVWFSALGGIWFFSDVICIISPLRKTNTKNINSRKNIILAIKEKWRKKKKYDDTKKVGKKRK